MKLTLSITVYLLMAALLGWSILLTVHGKPWLLIAAALGYVVALGAIGCREPRHD